MLSVIPVGAWMWHFTAPCQSSLGQPTVAALPKVACSTSAYSSFNLCVFVFSTSNPCVFVFSTSASSSGPRCPRVLGGRRPTRGPMGPIDPANGANGTQKRFLEGSAQKEVRRFGSNRLTWWTAMHLTNIARGLVGGSPPALSAYSVGHEEISKSQNVI